MKYRIKIYKFNDGVIQYDAYVKVLFKWVDLNPDCRFITREAALAKIDEHYGDQLKSIEFEYINKRHDN